MKQEELSLLLEEWKPRLRVADWEITANFERIHYFNNGESGLCFRQLTLRRASIKILEPMDYQADMGLKEDPEQILVHELLHVVFAGVGNAETTELGEAADLNMEQGIDGLATLLVTMKRETELARLEGRSECLDQTIDKLKSLNSRP